MDMLTYRWKTSDAEKSVALALVRGTHGTPYTFGDEAAGLGVEVGDFFIGTVPVTQDLWLHVMGTNPSLHRGSDLPLENVSWDEIAREGGFLERANSGAMRTTLATQLGKGGMLRLPTETEWEYAARGGPFWADRFHFSGSNDIDAIAWYGRKHGDHTQPVALKAPNQLGLYDMSGNVWEWCQDTFTRTVAEIPRNGEPFAGAAHERVLRGGCFHNWAMHCAVSKRYEIARDYRDECIGLRLVFAIDGPGAR